MRGCSGWNPARSWAAGEETVGLSCCLPLQQELLSATAEVVSIVSCSGFTVSACN